MLNNLLGAGAEASTCAEGAGERADDHVDLVRVYVLVFGDAAACSAEDSVGPGFVEDEAEFEAGLELDLAVVFSKTSFCNDAGC